jgi:hypothetical protein
LRAVRILSVAVLLLAIAAPAAFGKPFGKPRTLGTTPLAYEYGGLFTADGPRGGVAFYAAGEKQVGSDIDQRLFLARVEGSGRTHRLTAAPVHAPFRDYDGGPPYLDLAVGPHWRMLTTEYRKGDVYGIRDVFGVQLSPGGRRVAAHKVGPDNEASASFNANARGDAIAELGDGFAIARAAGRFARAPKALRRHGDYLAEMAADRSIYEWRVTGDGGRAIAHSASGRRWGRAQRVSGPGVAFHELASSPAGDALLVYGTGDGIDFSTVLARWSRRGHPFGAPVKLTSRIDADPFSVEADAIRHGGFAVQWRDHDGGHHLVRAHRAGGRFRAAVTWTPPKSADWGRLLPLRSGRTVAVWEIHDPDLVKPDKLKAAVIGRNRKMGPAQTVAVSARGPDFDGVALHRLAGKRAALVWTQRHGRKKRVRIAFTMR